MLQNEREPNPLCNFFELVKIEQQRYQHYEKKKSSAAEKNKQFLEIVSGLNSELLQCLHFEDARKVVEKNFETAFQHKIMIVDMDEEQDSKFFSCANQSSYAEVNAVAFNQRRELPEFEEQIPSTQLVGKKRNAPEPRERSSLMEISDEEEVKLENENEVLSQDIGNLAIVDKQERKELDENYIAKQLRQNKFSQQPKLPVNSVNMGSSRNIWTLSRDQSQALYAVGGNEVCIMRSGDFLDQPKLALSDSKEEKQFGTSLCLANKMLVISCYNLNQIYAFSSVNPSNPNRVTFKTQDLTLSLAAFGTDAFLAGQMDGYIQLFDFGRFKNGVNLRLQNKAEVNQIRRSLKCFNEFALATTKGLQFVEFSKEKNILQQDETQVHLKGASITSFFEFDTEQFVVNVVEQNTCFLVYNRAKKLTVRKVQDPKPGCQWVELCPLQSFHKDSFPYILLREKDNLYIANIKKGEIYTLLQSQPCNYIQFNKHFLLNTVSPDQSSLSIFLLTERLNHIYLEEFAYSEQFLKALKILATQNVANFLEER